MPSKKDAAATEPAFETALLRLEEIVDQMESSKLPLEDLLKRYEEGVRLLKVCSEKLDAAEKRIKAIARDAVGKPQVQDFDSVEPVPTSEQRDDISLF